MSDWRSTVRKAIAKRSRNLTVLTRGVKNGLEPQPEPSHFERIFFYTLGNRADASPVVVSEEGVIVGVQGGTLRIRDVSSDCTTDVFDSPGTSRFL